MRLGTPAHALVLAASEGHEPDAPWVLVPEEMLTHLTTVPARSRPTLIRADMTFFEAPNNGAVFSTGSITFCGSLPHNGFDNNCSRLLQNVLDRFLDPRRNSRSRSGEYVPMPDDESDLSTWTLGAISHPAWSSKARARRPIATSSRASMSTG